MCGMTPPSEVRIVSSTCCVLTLKSFSGIDTSGGSDVIDGVLSLCNNCAILISALCTDFRDFGDSTSPLPFNICNISSAILVKCEFISALGKGMMFGISATVSVMSL